MEDHFAVNQTKTSSPELLAKSQFKLKKAQKIIKPMRYNLSTIPYDHIVKIKN